jgi:hypothetical protein
MWSSWVKRKGTTQVMYIAKLKDGPKRVKKTFSVILEGVFEMVWWRGRKWNHIKTKILMLKCFSPLRILTSPLFQETLGVFFFFLFFSFSLFFNIFSLSFFLSFSLCSVSWGFDDIWGEKSLLQKFLFKWNHMVKTVDILAVDAYSEWSYARQYI